MRRPLQRTISQSALRLLPAACFEPPSFMLIGAQRCGTTAIYRWLAAHPSVVPARRKELHYFYRGPPMAPLSQYRRQFPNRASFRWATRGADSPAITGESTPYYLFHPYAPARVRDAFPEVKLIAVVRDPVERAVSHYWHSVRRGVENLSLVDAIRAEHDRLAPDEDAVRAGRPLSAAHARFSYVARGRYVEQLERWRGHFREDQLLVVRFESIVHDDPHERRRVLDFLDLSAGPGGPAPPTHLNAAPKHESTPDEAVSLIEQGLVGHNDELEARFGVAL